MLFNSFEFIFIFLPILLLVIYILRKYSLAASHNGMIIASLFFYALLDLQHLWVLLLSAAWNYGFGNLLINRIKREKNTFVWLWIGISFNLALLGGYKYISFLTQFVGWDFPSVVAPLGISFFTFHQLAYLIDIHRRRIFPTGINDYALYVTFFPHLIAGPIMRYAQFAPQLCVPKHTIAYGAGIFFFSVGLFKKTVLADTFAPIADRIFSAVTLEQPLLFWDAWKGVFAYTWQIYFDFSGYADMAIGLGLLMGIALPINFDAPYKATSMIDFWRRWHITLSEFLRDYVYIPLGGSRNGKWVQITALLLTMTLAGLWHGAALTFVLWGVLHGAFLSLVHIWRFTLGRVMTIPIWISVALTFMTVSTLWVLFRAENFVDVMIYYRSMLNYTPPTLSNRWFLDPIGREWLWIILGGMIIFLLKPTARYVRYHHAAYSSETLKAKTIHGVISGVLLWLSFKAMTDAPSRSFVYFVF